MNQANYSGIAFEFGSWMRRKITPLHRNSLLPVPRIFLWNWLTLNCHSRRSRKLLSVFHQRMVSLGYHFHCDQNKRTQRLFVILDSRYKVTVAESPLWCFPLPTDTDTKLSRTLGPHGLIDSLNLFARHSIRDNHRWHWIQTKCRFSLPRLSNILLYWNLLSGFHPALLGPISHRVVMVCAYLILDWIRKISIRAGRWNCNRISRQSPICYIDPRTSINYGVSYQNVSRF